MLSLCYLQYNIFMIQFDNFTIQTKISENNIRLEKLRRTVGKIKQNSLQIQMKVVQRVNKVAFFNVQLRHTSEYTLELGSDYYAKVKEKTAIEILENRIEFIEDQNKKWNQLKNNLIKKAEKNPVNELDFGRNIQSIGQNEDGEQIFNIVQYQPPSIPQIKFDPNSRLQLSKQNDNISTTMNQQQEEKKAQNFNVTMINSSQNEKIEEKEVENKNQKKVSKFKAERMKMKQQ